jgi:hypothetical protein
MMDRMMRTHDDRHDHLNSALEEERERMRMLRDQTANERIDLATNAAQGVQQITSKLMEEEAKRVQISQRAQAEHSQMLLTTLTSIFSQQQTMMQTQLEAQRRADQFRLEQERERGVKDREDAAEKRRRDQMEYEERRRREKDENKDTVHLPRRDVEMIFRMMAAMYEVIHAERKDDPFGSDVCVVDQRSGMRRNITRGVRIVLTHLAEMLMEMDDDEPPDIAMLNVTGGVEQ